MPILGNILLEASDAQLRLASTNLEVSISYRLEAVVLAPGETTVPAKLFSEFIGSLVSEGDMSLALTDDKLRVRSGKTTGHFKTVSAKDFPQIPVMADQPAVTLPIAAVKAMIEEVAVDAATDLTRPVFTGVLTTVAPDSLTMVAADGFRLGYRQQEIAGGPEQDLSLLIPAKCLLDLARILPDGKDGETVDIAVTNPVRQVLFRTGNLEMSARLIDGQFPNWQAVVPKAFVADAVVPTEEMLHATQVASFFARDHANLVKIEVDHSRVRVSAQSESLGDQSSEIDAETKGDAVELGFNSVFLRTSVAALGGDRVVVRFSSGTGPALVHRADDEGDKGFQVIMPMAITK